jgi:hypothetical protein
VGVVAGAVGLRDAPEGERVLQVSRGPGPPQITPGEELPQPVRRPRLARVGPHPGRLGVHRREVPAERLHRERGRDVEGVQQPGHVRQDERAVPHRHAVGANKREPLLGLEPHRFETRHRKRLVARHPAPAVVGLAAPDEDLSDLGHLGEVGLPNRPPESHHRVHPGVQGVGEGPHELRPYPHAALRHPVGARDHHRPHDLGGYLGSLVGGVTAHQLGGELLKVLQGYTIARERAHPRVSTVDEVPALQHPVHHVPRPPHALQRRG